MKTPESWFMGRKKIGNILIHISQIGLKPFQIILSSKTFFSETDILLAEFKTEKQAKIYFDKLIKLQERLKNGI